MTEVSRLVGKESTQALFDCRSETLYLQTNYYKLLFKLSFSRSSLGIYLVCTIKQAQPLIGIEMSQFYKKMQVKMSEEGITPRWAGSLKGLYLEGQPGVWRPLSQATPTDGHDPLGQLSSGNRGGIKSVFINIYYSQYSHFIIYSVPNALLVRSHISSRMYLFYAEILVVHTSQRQYSCLIKSESLQNSPKQTNQKALQSLFKFLS